METSDADREALRSQIAAEPMYSPKIFALIQQNGPEFAIYLGTLVSKHRELLSQEEADARPFVTGWEVSSAPDDAPLDVSIVTYEHNTTAIMLSGEDQE